VLEADWLCAIINTGSIQGITLPTGETAYDVSKAGLNALTESLADDLLDTGGQVSAHLLTRD
jgi:NAD(P)-dependent dehydrogenase (short-subunit alcohol dehydrogenase family)